MSQTNIEMIAEIVHEAMRAHRRAIGQPPLPSWLDAEDWMRQSTRASVQFCLDRPAATAEDLHDHWMADRARNGWSFGAVRDDAAKRHPLLVPFDQLPEVERRKDQLIIAIVRAMT